MSRAIGITDGNAGTVAQVRALAEAMHCELELITVAVNPLWRVLPNAAFDLGVHCLFPVTSQPPPEGKPELAISCGRKAALVSAFWNMPGTRRIHIHDPQMSPAHFDAVIAMEHDWLAGANIIQARYALHTITPEKLQAAVHHWEPRFAHLPRPWRAVLIGGSTNKYTFTAAAMRELIGQVERIDGSLLITTSRRTGADNIQLLHTHFSSHARRVFLYTGELENPYLGLLACADEIYVTNDSVNMMSEAMATGKPVHILNLSGHQNTKPAWFAARLQGEKNGAPEMMAGLVASVRQVLAAGA